MDPRRVILLLIFCFLMIPTFGIRIHPNSGLEVTPETRVEKNDVVKLNYTLYIDTAIVEQQNGTVWVHDPNDPNAPNELYEQFPDLTVPPNVGFLNGILGMRAGDSWNFDVFFSSGEAFNNDTDPFYLEDLFYEVVLLEILIDVTEIPTTLFDLPFFIPFLALILFLLTIIIYYRIKRYGQSRNLFGSKIICNACTAFATVQCGNPSCNTPYCKKCFIEKNHCHVCNSNKMVPLKP